MTQQIEAQAQYSCPACHHACYGNVPCEYCHLQQTVSRLIALLGEWRTNEHIALDCYHSRIYRDLCKRTDSELKGGQW